jgi:catechol 2,3-dioxygenase-like lactoylglutathione lyase family enzyme
MTATHSTSLIAALHTERPAADRADNMGLYAFLVGRWEFHGTVHRDDGTKHTGRGEIHAGWALEGRCLQDVWILPGVFYGTTLRVYDPGLDAWHIFWIDPTRQFYPRQIGRARGRDIVQEGKADDGAAYRWSFSDIKADSFRWLGERSRDGGKTWHVQAEYFASRVAGAAAASRAAPMLDHVSIGVRDVAQAKRFYDAALGPLGYALRSEGADSLGYGDGAVTLWISAAARPVPPDEKSGLHFCFSAPTRASVDAFHAAALRSGGRDNGKPGVRADYGPDYYAAFAIDPDGYRLEAYCNRPT